MEEKRRAKPKTHGNPGILSSHASVDAKAFRWLRRLVGTVVRRKNLVE